MFGAGAPRPLPGPLKPGGAIPRPGPPLTEGGTATPLPDGIPLPGPPVAVSFSRVSSAGGGPSTEREITVSPRTNTSPSGRFSSLSSPLLFPFGIIFRNSSQSPRIKFMCLSNAINLPIKVLLS
jgi:hypothetical protein